MQLSDWDRISAVVAAPSGIGVCAYLQLYMSKLKQTEIPMIGFVCIDTMPEGSITLQYNEFIILLQLLFQICY